MFLPWFGHLLLPSKYAVQANLQLTIKCREPPPLEGRSSRVGGNKRNGGASKASDHQNLSNHPTTRGSAGLFPPRADEGDLVACPQGVTLALRDGGVGADRGQPATLAPEARSLKQGTRLALLRVLEPGEHRCLQSTVFSSVLVTPPAFEPAIAGSHGGQHQLG